MNKTLIGIIIGILAVAVIWTFVASRSDGPESAQTAATSTAEQNATGTPALATTTAPASFSGSFSELVGYGDSRCTFTQTVEGIANTGTVYVSGGRMRADIDSKVPQYNITVKSHVIRESEWLYVWSDMLPKGFKVKADPEAVANAQKGNTQTFDYNQKLDFSCSPWVSDGSVFAVPANITFTEEVPRM